MSTAAASHKFLGVIDRHDLKAGTMTFRVVCSCGHKTKAQSERADALADFDAHAAVA